MSQLLFFFEGKSNFTAYTTNGKSLVVRDKALKKSTICWLYFIKYRKNEGGRNVSSVRSWLGMILLIVAG